MIFKIKRSKNFTVLSNFMLRDLQISLKAKGLLCQLMSHTEKYEISIRKLVKQNIEGKDAIMSALNELIQFGYITRSESRSRGRYQFQYIISDEPIKDDLREFSPVRVNRIGKTESDNPHTQEITKKKRKHHQSKSLEKTINEKRIDLNLSDDDDLFEEFVERKKKEVLKNTEIENKKMYLIRCIENLKKEDLEILRNEIENKNKGDEVERKKEENKIDAVNKRNKGEKLYKELGKSQRDKILNEIIEFLPESERNRIKIFGRNVEQLPESLRNSIYTKIGLVSVEK